MGEQSIEHNIAKYMKLLCANDLTTSSGGNISARTADGSIFITPSGPGKNMLRASDIIRLEPAGPVSGKDPQPSMEFQLHLSIYRARGDINAVIHAHPLFATAFLATERQIDFDLTAESRVMIGSTATVPFAPCGSKELASSVSAAAKGSNLILLENHGVVAVGSSLQQAYNRIELTEAAAKTTFIGEVAGDRRSLSPDQLDLIDMLLGNEKME
ncbi:MAG: class II aldolase/adducin family protein [Candidatus Krumholzibacteriota bacterium]|nr:class II aldolase/adducin family protein [Candidatus Krumholzibacteriota bacterium]